MSRWNLLRSCALAALLFSLTACGNKDNPQPQANHQEAAPANKKDAESKDDKARDSRDKAVTNMGQAAYMNNKESKSDSPTLHFDPIAPPNQHAPRQLASPEPKADRFAYRLARLLPVAFSGANFTARKVEGGGFIPGFDGAGQPGVPADPRDGKGDFDSDTENYERIFDNPYKLVKHDPLSTISSTVDTASYSNVRGRLNAGHMPAKDAVRIADMLNYFNYDYAGPKNDEPVAFSLEIAPCPWQPKHHLLRIGLKAKTIDKDKMPPRNLTFLIDTSGSMNQQNKLPLVKESLKLLVQQLTEKDMVSIVTYAGNAGVALPPTPGSEKDTILKMIDSFNASGSTNGEGGLKSAYELAKAAFIKDGINRVILTTDGDFNVGLSSDADMVRLIEEKRDTGVYLTVLGYGMGNLKDSKLEQLAHHGNGHYAYIDTLDEAKKVFVEQGGSLVTVAKDVKLQVEFNPAKVAGYRLIGYENRILRNEDFRNDKKDAGDLGSGHMCTALYEIVPNGEKVEGEVEPLKYQTVPKLSDASKSGEFATVRMRYKDPLTEKAKEVEAPLPAEALGKKVSNDFEFAACVASFGMLLRESEFKGIATYQATLETVEGLLRDKKDAYREEFAKLVRVAFTIEQAKKK